MYIISTLYSKISIFRKKKKTMKLRKDGFTDQRAIVLPQSILNIMDRNPITRLLHITDIGYYPNAEGHFIKREEGSRQNILIYCTEGEGWYSIDGVRQKVSKSQFFIIEAGKPHIYAANESNPWTIYWTHFTGEQAHLFKDIYNRTLSIDDSQYARIQDRIILFEEVYQNLEMGYSPDNLEYSSLCLWHFLASFKYMPQFREVNKNKQTDIIQKAIIFMKKNLEKSLTLSDIAKSVNYSPSHFGQIFQKKTGSTPLAYFTQMKIQKACQLLDFSDLRIKELASLLGFYDQYHFSKVFTKHIGESPSVYKKKNKG